MGYLVKPDGSYRAATPEMPPQTGETYYDVLPDLSNSDVELRAARVKQRRDAAETGMKVIPNWATWTQADWATWRDANMSATQINAISNIADAIVVLNKMANVMDKLAQMEIYLRDWTKPDNPE